MCIRLSLNPRTGTMLLKTSPDLTPMKLLGALSMALGVVLPWMAGLVAGQATHGAIASFGAYLMMVSFPRLPEAGRAKVLLSAAFVISLFAMVGGRVELGSGPFFACALAAALAQGAGELRGGYLRLPVALAALAFFLSVDQVPAGGDVIYGLTFLAGTLWALLFVLFFIPVAKKAVDVERLDLLKNAAQRRFLAGIASISLLGSIAACFSPGSHPCWLAAAGLRVTKPTRRETLYRMKARGLGTLLGAAAGGLMLGFLAPAPWLHALLVGALVFVMLVIGAKRYGIWSFCLTAVALTFNFSPEAGALAIAANRVLLTIAGIGVACLMLPLLPPSPDADRQGG